MSDVAMRSRRAFGGLIPRLVAVLVLPAILSMTAGCGGAGRGQIVFSSGGGVIIGIVYLDADGSGSPGGPDQALPGVRVGLVVDGTIDTLGSVTSDANGAFVFGARPPARYRVVVPTSTVFGDSLKVGRIDPEEINLGVDDTTSVRVAISFPIYTVAEARARPINEKFFVEGVALNNRVTFGDSTLHLRDTTGALRITGARGEDVSAAYSVRVLGQAAARDGQPVVAQGRVTVVGIGVLPVAVDVATAVAALADGGALDADLVRVLDATAIDSASVGGDYVLTVDDGSGPVRVVFDQHAGLTRTPYVPGVLIDATGLLVPDGSGGWVIKPRGNPDVVLK